MQIGCKFKQIFKFNFNDHFNKSIMKIRRLLTKLLLANFNENYSYLLIFYQK